MNMLTAIKRFSKILSYNCTRCGQTYSADAPQTYATCCCQPLSVAYDLAHTSKEMICYEDLSMWRYAALLPVLNKENIISLGEGMTPCVTTQEIRRKIFPFRYPAQR